MAPAASRPYGGWFDDVADALERAYPQFAEAIEKVVVEHGEITLHVRRAAPRDVAQVLRDDAALRFEMCLGVSGVHWPGDTDRELHAVYPLLSYTHNRRIKLEVSCPDARSAHPVAVLASTPPTTGTSARPTTSSASSSTGTRR